MLEWFCTEHCAKAALCIDLAVQLRRQPAVHLLGWRKESGTSQQGGSGGWKIRGGLIILLNAEAASPVVENHPWQLGRDAGHEGMWTSIKFENWGNKRSTELREVIKKIPIPKYNTLLVLYFFFFFILQKRKNSWPQTDFPDRWGWGSMRDARKHQTPMRPKTSLCGAKVLLWLSELLLARADQCRAACLQTHLRCCLLLLSGDTLSSEVALL